MNAATATTLSPDEALIAQPREDTVPFRTWIAVLGALLGAFMAVLDIQITNSSLQDITGGIGATLDEGSWISIAYLVPEIVVIPLCGWLASVFGLRRYLLWNSALFLIFSVCCGFARSLESMIAFRALQGFTGGALIPMASMMVLTMLPASKQALGFALFGLSAMFAPAIGPSIGGWLTDTYSWPWVFFLNLVPGVLFLAGIAYGLDSTPAKWHLLKKGDWSGIIFMALGLGSLTIFLEEGTRKDWFSAPMITRLAIISAIALPIFIVLQFCRRSVTPLVNLRLFAQRNFAIGSLVNLVVGLALYGIIYLLSLYLAQVQRYNALEIGRTMMWVGLPQLAIMPLVPLLTKWVDKRILVAVGLAVFAFSGTLMSYLTADFGHDQLILPQVVRALGLPLVIVPLSLITTGGVGKENAASASGLFNMLRNLGGSIGIALLSALLTWREHFHSNRLGEVISAYNPLTRERLDTLAQVFTTQGLDVVTAQDRAVGLLDAGVRQQAYLLAFNDCFHVVAVLLFAMVPLILMCRKAVGGDATGAH